MNQQDAVSIISPSGEPDSDFALLADVREYLGRHEAINTIQLAGFLARDTFDPSTPVLVATTADQIVGVATVSSGFNLLLSHIAHDDATAETAAEAVRRGIDIPGVMGLNQAALDFARCWRRLTGGSYAAGISRRILAATAVNLPASVPGAWREITAEDYPMLADWLTDFGVESDHMTPAVARRHSQSMLQLLDDRGGGLMWLDETGLPVSFARYKAPTFTGIRIGPVYTPPEHRRRGYGGAVTATATQLMLERGCTFVCLYTDAGNPTSNHIYEEIGYEFVADSMQYQFSGAATIVDTEHGRV